MWVIYIYIYIYIYTRMCIYYVAKDMTNCSVGPIFRGVNDFTIFQSSSKFPTNITGDDCHYDRQFYSKYYI